MTATVLHAPGISPACGTQEFPHKLSFSHKPHIYTGPIVVMDRSLLIDNLQRFQSALPRISPHYAVKCLPDAKVLQTLWEQGSAFEIASQQELQQLLDLGVDASKILYSNPIKSPAHIYFAASQGIQWFAVDALEEMDKIIAIKPNASLYLRIHVSNEGSQFPLVGKFGALEQEIEEILLSAAKRGIHLAGVTFHVGSQCPEANNWCLGIQSAKRIFARMQDLGLKPQLLNIGGGFPVQINQTVPSIEDIANVINEEIEGLDPDIKIVAEPGRYFVASAASLVCRVVGTATRGGQRWLYLDTGFYGGLMEMSQGFDYTLTSDRSGKNCDWTIAGPTCDSIDVCQQHVSLPADLQADDFVYILCAGAYTISCASTFNGFPAPELVLI